MTDPGGEGEGRERLILRTSNVEHRMMNAGHWKLEVHAVNIENIER